MAKAKPVEKVDGNGNVVATYRMVVQGGMDEDVIAALHDKGDTQESLMQALKARIERAKTA